MAGIWTRIKTIFKAKANSALSNMENPEEIINQTINDMQEEYRKAKAAVAQAIAGEKRMEEKLSSAKKEAEKWQEKAKLALQKGDEALAKEILTKYNQANTNAVEYEKEWRSQKTQVQHIKDQLRKLQKNIERARNRKDLIIAKSKRAEANKKIAETMSGIDTSSAFDAFERMENKVDDLSAEAKAAEEMNEEFGMSSDDKLETKLSELEIDSSVDDQLAKMKADLGLTPPAEKKEEPKKETDEENKPSAE